MGQISYNDERVNDVLTRYGLGRAGGIETARRWVEIVNDLAPAWFDFGHMAAGVQITFGSNLRLHSDKLPSREAFTAHMITAITAIGASVNTPERDVLFPGDPLRLTIDFASLTPTGGNERTFAVASIKTPGWVNVPIWKTLPRHTQQSTTTTSYSLTKLHVQRAWSELNAAQ